MHHSQILSDSESTLKAIIDSAIDGIIAIDSNGVIESVNPAGLRLFGYALEELIGENINKLVPSPHHNAHDQYIKNYLKTKIPKIIGKGREVKGLRKDGSQFPLRLSVSEVILKDRIIFTGIIHDLSAEHKAQKKIEEYQLSLEKKVKERTIRLNENVKALEKTNDILHQQIRERKLAEEALKNSQALYKTVARNFPNGAISVFDKNLHYVFVEGKELFRMGIKSEDLVGKPIQEHLPKEIVDEVVEKLETVFTGETQNFETNFNDNHYVISAVPLYDTSNKINEIMIVEVNVTESKHAEQEIKNALKREKELNQMKSAFISLASHEFRTPLSSILSSATLTQKYTTTEQQPQRTKHIKRIISNVKTLNSILNDFLSISKLEEGKVQAKFEDFNLIEFCDEVVEDMQSFLKSGQRIHKNLQTACAFIKQDQNILKNILINLLSNAAKYSPDDSTIDFSLKCIDETIEIQVADKGIGIPLKDQEQLFSRFFRASNSGNIQGTGLGLNIVKNYVELLNGTISFKSVEFEGTTFYVTLPKY